MDRSFTTVGRLAAALAVVSAATAITAPSAFADPPNHSRYFHIQAKAGLTHEPEIISGIASPAARARLAREPEVVSGIVPPDVRDHRLIGQLVRADRLSSQSGFDWRDAGIGAATTLAAVLVAFGGGLLIRRRSWSPSAAGS
jgi:hypothetical protein